ncbi:MAG: alpha/beta fold hydrolase [Thermoguttaceae bacterium]
MSLLDLQVRNPVRAIGRRAALPQVASIHRGVASRTISAGMVLSTLAVILFSMSSGLAAADRNATRTSKPKLPKPEDVSIETDDGVELALTYYPGPNGKQSVPVVLLHGWKQSRNDFRDMALALQAAGCAVVTPDLRGHGQSLRRKGVQRDETLNAATMSSGQFAAMADYDMMAVKKFLWKRNNAGELNLDKLCLIGAEMGASVALNFALADARDQDDNPVARADYKIGRFVKALVLISPELAFRGLPVRQAAVYPPIRDDVSMLIFVGRQDSKAFDEAKRVHGLVERHRPEPTGVTAAERNDKRTLFFVKCDTRLQGEKLLDPRFNLSGLTIEFIQRRLIKSESSKAWTWQERKIPHG